MPKSTPVKDLVVDILNDLNAYNNIQTFTGQKNSDYKNSITERVLNHAEKTPKFKSRLQNLLSGTKAQNNGRIRCIGRLVKSELKLENNENNLSPISKTSKTTTRHK